VRPLPVRHDATAKRPSDQLIKLVWFKLGSSIRSTDATDDACGGRFSLPARAAPRMHEPRSDESRDRTRGRPAWSHLRCIDHDTGFGFHQAAAPALLAPCMLQQMLHPLVPYHANKKGQRNVVDPTTFIPHVVDYSNGPRFRYHTSVGREKIRYFVSQNVTQSPCLLSCHQSIGGH
jgi:hypothetical protein